MIHLERPAGWRFGPDALELNAVYGRLMRGHERISLTDKELDLLILLVEHQQETVDKDEIIRSVWGGNAVADNLVAQTFHRLRRKIGGTVIATAHGVGYRLACAAEPIGSLEELEAQHLIALFIDAEERRQSLPDPAWNELYRPRLDQVRKALVWAFESPLRQRLAIDLAGATGRLWERSTVEDGRHYLDQALQLLNASTPPRAEARLRYHAGLLWREPNRRLALVLFQRAAELYRKLGDQKHLGRVLGVIGDAQIFLGQLDEAHTTLQEARKILQYSVETKALCNVWSCLGVLSSIQGLYSDAAHYHAMARDVAVILDDPLRTSVAEMNIGEAQFAAGQAGEAIAHAKESVRVLGSTFPTFRLRPMTNLALYYGLSDEIVEAKRIIGKALPLFGDIGGHWLRLCAQAAALILALEGQYSEACRVFGFVGRRFDEIGEIRETSDLQSYNKLTDILFNSLNSDMLCKFRDEGAEWTESQAIRAVSHCLGEIKVARTRRSAR